MDESLLPIPGNPSKQLNNQMNQPSQPDQKPADHPDIDEYLKIDVIPPITPRQGPLSWQPTNQPVISIRSTPPPVQINSGSVSQSSFDFLSPQPSSFPRDLHNLNSFQELSYHHQPEYNESARNSGPSSSYLFRILEDKIDSISEEQRLLIVWYFESDLYI
jgi:hypothetical protein